MKKQSKVVLTGEKRPLYQQFLIIYILTRSVQISSSTVKNRTIILQTIWVSTTETYIQKELFEKEIVKRKPIKNGEPIFKIVENWGTKNFIIIHNSIRLFNIRKDAISEEEWW